MYGKCYRLVRSKEVPKNFLFSIFFFIKYDKLEIASSSIQGEIVPVISNRPRTLRSSRLLHELHSTRPSWYYKLIEKTLANTHNATHAQHAMEKLGYNAFPVF